MLQPERRKTSDVHHTEPAKVRLLAVDDDKAYLSYLRLLLTRAGFEVSLAYDGDTGLRKLLEDPTIQLLLVDLAMPLMDGLQTIRKLQEQGTSNSLYKILLTAHTGSEMKVLALDSGFDDFMAKSDSEQEIIAKLRSAARRMELERQLHLENVELQALAFTDELTGVGNRRALARACEELAAADRQFVVVLFDLDDFKRINDVFGHLMGDEVLIKVAECLEAKTRVGDVIVRYGGDEFVVLLPGVGETAATRIAARIEQGIRGIEWQKDREALQVRASYGLATGARDLGDVLRLCDARLYRSKRGGGSGPESVARSAARP